jgi:hypothetical protein
MDREVLCRQTVVNLSRMVMCFIVILLTVNIVEVKRYIGVRCRFLCAAISDSVGFNSRLPCVSEGCQHLLIAPP